jgi:hypothetical protein
MVEGHDIILGNPPRFSMRFMAGRSSEQSGLRAHPGKQLSDWAGGRVDASTKEQAGPPKRDSTLLGPNYCAGTELPVFR